MPVNNSTCMEFYFLHATKNLYEQKRVLFGAQVVLMVPSEMWGSFLPQRKINVSSEYDQWKVCERRSAHRSLSGSTDEGKRTCRLLDPLVTAGQTKWSSVLWTRQVGVR